MKTIKVFKAQRIMDEIPSVQIVLDVELPRLRHESVYEYQAKEIEDALHFTLPGATYDQLLGLMLARKASHFRVAHQT